MQIMEIAGHVGHQMLVNPWQGVVRCLVCDVDMCIEHAPVTPDRCCLTDPSLWRLPQSVVGLD